MKELKYPEINDDYYYYCSESMSPSQHLQPPLRGQR